MSFVLSSLMTLGVGVFAVFELGKVNNADTILYERATVPMADLLKLFLYMTVVVVLFYSRAYIMDRESMNKGEYYVLTLFATLGMMVMISANHFLTIYMGLSFFHCRFTRWWR